MEKYLVVLSAHINNEHKFAVVKEHLEELKKDNIDVCLSTNSNNYIQELSKYVKYIIYDTNNELLKTEDFVKNVELVYSNPINHGSMLFTYKSSLGFELITHLPFSPHSKPALLLFRNGCNVAHINGYKWAVCIEYDIPKPIKGYRNQIEDMIQRLEYDNKHAYVYNNNDTSNHNSIKFLWGGMFIVGTDIINSTLLKQNWHVSNYDWIKTWSLTFFEYCISAVISEMWGDNIIVDDISTHSETLWGVKDYREIQKSQKIVANRRFINNASYEWIHVVPKKEDDKYKLNLFTFCSQSCVLKNIKVYYDEQIVCNLEEITISSGQNWLWSLPDYVAVDEIKLSYEVDAGIGYEPYMESFKTKDIHKIHEKLFSIY